MKKLIIILANMFIAFGCYAQSSSVQSNEVEANKVVTPQVVETSSSVKSNEIVTSTNYLSGPQSSDNSVSESKVISNSLPKSHVQNDLKQEEVTEDNIQILNTRNKTAPELPVELYQRKENQVPSSIPEENYRRK